MTDFSQDRRDFIAGSAAVAALISTRGAAAQDADPTDLDIGDAGRLIRDRSLSPVDLTGAYLDRIRRIDPDLNAFITVTEERAQEQAAVLEAELSNGNWRGPLHGIPIALKDNIDTGGVLTTAASALFANRVPDEDAEVVRRLKEAGAVVLGKLNMQEFAFGGTSDVTHYGAVHNPWNLDYIPGGSSGGSAAAVSAHLCAAALGTDTAASIRMPASFCSIVGLKATYGLVSIRGIFPLSESLDHVGPMTRSVGDAALMLQAMAGFDPLDYTSIRADIPQYSDALIQSVAGLRLGIPGKPFFDSLQADVEGAVAEAINLLTGMTATVSDTDLPATPPFPPIIAEAYAYHAEYLADESNHALYQPLTLERLLAGAGASRLDYMQAIRELAIARKMIDGVFEQVDLLITPTVPVVAHPIGKPHEDVPVVPEITTQNTLPFDFYGIPTISVPCGFSGDGLPIGLQISGPRLGEMNVFRLADAYERATDWHTRRPPIS